MFKDWRKNNKYKTIDLKSEFSWFLDLLKISKPAKIHNCI